MANARRLAEQQQLLQALSRLEVAAVGPSGCHGPPIPDVLTPMRELEAALAIHRALVHARGGLLSEIDVSVGQLSPQRQMLVESHHDLERDARELRRRLEGASPPDILATQEVVERLSAAIRAHLARETVLVDSAFGRDILSDVIGGA